MNTAQSLKQRFDQLQQEVVARMLELMPTSNVETEPIRIVFNTPVQVHDYDSITEVKRVGQQLFLISNDDAEMPIEDFDDLATVIHIIGRMEKVDKGERYNEEYEIIPFDE